MRTVGFRFFQIYYCLIHYYPTETLRHLTERELMLVLINSIPYFYLEFFKDDSYSRKVSPFFLKKKRLNLKVISTGLISLFHNRSSYIDANLARACFINLIKILEYIPSQKKTIKPKLKETQIGNLNF